MATDSGEKRERAADLFDAGHRQADVARELGVSRVTAMHWHRLWCRAGRRALVQRRRRGRKPRLEIAAAERIHAALHDSPREWGFDSDRWNAAQVALLIERVTGLVYHRRHIGRLLRRAGWIVPPVGRFADQARYGQRSQDIEGNVLMFVSTAKELARRSRNERGTTS